MNILLIMILICPIYILLRSCVVNCEPLKAGTMHLLRPHPYSMGKRRRDWEVAELLNTHGKITWVKLTVLHHFECFNRKCIFRNVHMELLLEPFSPKVLMTLFPVHLWLFVPTVCLATTEKSDLVAWYEFFFSC